MFLLRICAAQERPLHKSRIKPGVRWREQPHRNVQRFRGGLLLRPIDFVYHSTPGLRIKKKSRGSWCDGNHGPCCRKGDTFKGLKGSCLKAKVTIWA